MYGSMIVDLIQDQEWTDYGQVVHLTSAQVCRSVVHESRIINMFVQRARTGRRHDDKADQ